MLKQHASALLHYAGDQSPPILCLYDPRFLPYVDAIKPRSLVYYAFDKYSKDFHWDESRMDAERNLVARADLLVASTRSIADDFPGDGPGRARILPNGVDYRAVAGLAGNPCPAAVAAIPRPRIGYCGVLNWKLDFPLVAELAVRRPDWHWVFVGPAVDRSGASDMGLERIDRAWTRCQSLPNVHFLGEKGFPEFAVGLHHMDVNVICNRLSHGWWQDAYPLKFHEYLAAGRPVVSSPVSSLLEFESVADFVSTTDEWADALERAIEAGGVGTIEQRRAVAMANDWNDRVSKLEGWLAELIQVTAG